MSKNSAPTSIELAYQHLGLTPDGHNIGTFRLIDLPEPILKPVTNHRLNQLYDQLERNIRAPNFKEVVAELCFIPFERWKYVLKNAEKYRPDRNPFHAAVDRYFLSDIYPLAQFNESIESWKRYLSRAVPDYYAFLKQDRDVCIPEKERLVHEYIVAASQKGKSEYMKELIYDYLTTSDYCAVLVLDPAGDFAREIAQWKEQATLGRLIYIDPVLDLERTPTINPFHIHGIKPSDTSRYAAMVKENVAERIVEALQEVLSEGESNELSNTMTTLLYPCVLTLLNRQGSTLEDLQRFMQDTRNEDLIALGKTLTHHSALPDCFTHHFTGKENQNLNPTKAAVIRKFHNLFHKSFTAYPVDSATPTCCGRARG